MDAASIRRASELFQAAADLPRHDRAAFLRTRCNDEALLAFVRQMLSDHEDQSGGPLDAPVLDGLVRTPMIAMPALPAKFGAYELVSVLGEGGMAVVYEARQQNPSRVVALKVLRPGVLSAELLRRFQHEIQVLGQLQHEGIAHIYEADVAEVPLPDGSLVRQPYFAMELIRGEPLNVYAAKHALNDGQKLELVARVCDAVQYAHQKGVIHRDLKPANILATSDAVHADCGLGIADSKAASGSQSAIRNPQSAIVKVLDFGVARVTGAELDAPTMNTEAGRLIGTLAYMSPEQVGGNVEETDTRSDVYSLGVILYELLCGRLPHETRNLPLPEAARKVCDEEPARLSSIDRRFRGDVDTIVARAMDKERSRRYASAGELGADIRRCLAGEAVEARRDSAIYVLNKGLRRHRGLAIGAGAALLALLAFVIYFYVQAHRFEVISAKEHKARVAAESVDKFLAGVIQLANPDPTRGYAMNLTDMLDDATHRLEKGELGADPDVEAQVRTRLAETYDNLELTDGVILHRKWLAEYEKKRSGEGSEEYLHALTALGDACVEGGHEPEGQAALKDALTICEARHGHESVESFRIIDTIGNSLMREGRAAESLAYSVPATEGIAKLMGPESYDTGFVYFNLAAVYRNLGRVEEMTRYYEKALAILERYPENLSTIRCRWSYANDVLRRDRKLDEAERQLRRAAELAAKQLGADHQETLATQRALAGVLLDKGDSDQAEQILVKAMETCRGVRRWSGPTEASLTLALAACQKARGELDGAAETFRTSMDRFERARGRHDRIVINLEAGLAGAERDRGRIDEAVKLFQDAIQRLIDDHREQDPQVASLRRQLAALKPQP